MRSLADMLMDPTAPWDFNTTLESGTVLIGRDEFPDVEVLELDVHEIKKIECQVIRAKDTNSGEDCIMRRLVGYLSNGEVVDIGERFAVPSVLCNTNVDMSTCGACREKIDATDGPVVYENKAYHPWCMDDDEEG